MNDRALKSCLERLLIPKIWHVLDLPGLSPLMGEGCVCSPFRSDARPSMSIYGGGRRFKDHAANKGGDALDFFAKALGVSRRNTVRPFIDLACGTWPTAPVAIARNEQQGKHKLRLEALKCPSPADIQSIAKLRRLSADAVAWAAATKILRVGRVCGFESWILADGPPGETPVIAEARRMDGRLYPAFKSLPPRKAHTLAGGDKSWPIGSSPLANASYGWRAIMMVEGGPDFLAAVHFAMESEAHDLLPIAVMGRANRKIHPAALCLLEARNVRIYPHADDDGGGEAAARVWALQIPDAVVTAFRFHGLVRQDGEAVTDLNDAAIIHPSQACELNELLP